MRGSCEFGVGDLPTLTVATLPHLIAHKFDMGFHPAAYLCMLQWINDRSISNKPLPINTDYYQRLTGVYYQNTGELKCQKELSAVGSTTTSTVKQST